MKTKLSRRVLAMLMSVLLCVSLFPASVFADADLGDAAEETAVEETTGTTASSDDETAASEPGEDPSATDGSGVDESGDSTTDPDPTDPEAGTDVDPEDPDSGSCSSETKTPVRLNQNLTAWTGIPMEYTWKTVKGENIESWSAPVSLPDGLACEQKDSTTIVISGTATAGGTYPITFSVESTDYTYSVYLTLTVVSSSGTCGAITEENPTGDNLTWTVDDEGTLTITGSGTMADWSSVSENPWYQNRKAIKNIIIGEGVENIGSYAFCGCSSLTGVTIPASVKTIGESAFSSCGSLTSVTLPDGLETIGAEAFYGTGLTSVTIPLSVTAISGSAFYSCYSLTELLVDEANETYCAVDAVLFSADKTTLVICPAGLTGCYTVPEDVTAIGESAFCGTGLSCVIFSGDAPTMGNNAFLDSTLSVYYPAGNNTWTTVVNSEDNQYGGDVTWVSYTAAGTCGAVTDENPTGNNLVWALDENGTLTISGTGAMADWTFSSAAPWYSIGTSVKSVVIEDGVTSIGGWAFNDCSALTSVTIPGSVTSIGVSAFEDCTGLTSVTIPDSVTSIGSSAFAGCTGLTSLIIGNGVTGIDTSAFYKCSGLTGVTIPDSVTSIGTAAFRGCSGLTSVTIPDSVTSIGSWVFEDCSSLTAINVEEDNSAYSSEAGVLFNKDKTTLLQYPQGKQGSYVIPGSVTGIGNLAFDGCTGLTSVTIPDSVTSIGGSAFAGCTGLTRCIFRGDYYEAFDKYMFGADTFTACYPADSTTWTQEARDSFTGNITWAQSLPVAVSCLATSDTEVTDRNGLTADYDISAISVSNATASYVPDDTDTAADAAEIQVVISSVTLGDNGTASEISYDITMTDSEGTVIADENINGAVVFRLPLDKNTTATSAEVIHDGTSMGIYPVQTDSDGNKFVEITVDSFSPFTVKMIELEEETVERGDVNGVGGVNMLDYLTLKKALASGDLSGLNPIGADVNADDSINLQDMLKLKQQLITGTTGTEAA